MYIKMIRMSSSKNLQEDIGLLYDFRWNICYTKLLATYVSLLFQIQKLEKNTDSNFLYCIIQTD